MVKAVLFDSGGVLMRPIGGRWNPRRDFEATVLAVAPGLTDEDFARAIAVGDRWMHTAPASNFRDDYHRVILGELGVEPAAELLAALIQPAEPASVVEPYPEVLSVLAELRQRGFRLAVVSDAEPALPTLHDAIGLGGFFEAYAISAVLDCTKPDPRMFRHASESLGLEPAECLFVDDVPRLVEAAIQLGYEAVALLREPPDSPCSVPSIQTLTQLLDLL